MAEHKVTLASPPLSVGHANIEIVVRSNDAKLGTLLISKGALVWKDRYGKKSRKVPWQQFANLMMNHVEKRPGA